MLLSAFKAPAPIAVAALIQDAGIGPSQLIPVPLPLAQGIPFGPALKSDGLPTKFHRSPRPMPLTTLVPLKSLEVSCGYHGWPDCRATMELIDQPCRICPGDFLPGSA